MILPVETRWEINDPYPRAGSNDPETRGRRCGLKPTSWKDVLKRPKFLLSRSKIDNIIILLDHLHVLTYSLLYFPLDGETKTTSPKPKHAENPNGEIKRSQTHGRAYCHTTEPGQFSSLGFHVYPSPKHSVCLCYCCILRLPSRASVLVCVIFSIICTSHVTMSYVLSPCTVRVYPSISFDPFFASNH